MTPEIKESLEAALGEWRRYLKERKDEDYTALEWGRVS
jgi:hypothetical protein